MLDERDYLARWIQGFCAFFLATFALVGAWMIWSSPFFMLWIGGGAVVCGAAYYSWRCMRYAFTGKNNVNRDDFL